MFQKIRHLFILFQVVQVQLLSIISTQVPSMIDTDVNDDLNFILLQLTKLCYTVSYVSALYRLERNETVVLNRSVDDVFGSFIHESMSHEQVVSFLKPGTVSFMFFITN